MDSSDTPLPPLNSLRAFEAAGRHLSFRSAADELGVTQSAVAQHVRALEALLDIRLFTREARGLALTDSGRLYHRHISSAFREMREATKLLRPRPSGVTISVTPTFASKWLIDRLPEFTAAHPDIDLRVLATEAVMSFRADGIDLAVRQGNPPFGASLDAALLFPQAIVAVCSPSLLQKGESEIPLERLSELVLFDTHDLWPRFIEKAFGAKGDLRLKGVRFNQTTLSIDAALSGQGVALASRFLVERELASGRLVQPIKAEMHGGQDFHLLSLKDPPKPVRVVRDWLLSHRD